MQFRLYNYEYYEIVENILKKIPNFAALILDWCKSGKKKERASFIREGNNNRCGCRRQGHCKSK